MEWAFWDTSSLIPLCVQQGSSVAAHELGGTYRRVVWWGACVEALGSFARMRRAEILSLTLEAQAQIRLEHLRRSWREISPTDALRSRAEDLVRRFGLTGADAFQLAAAWMWCNGAPRQKPFIAGDVKLLEAAEHLGFRPIAT